MMHIAEIRPGGDLPMRKRAAWVCAAALVALAGGVAAYRIVRGYDAVIAGLCGTHVLERAASPAAVSELVTFERDCGATTDFSTQVSLAPMNVPFSAERFVPFFIVRGRYLHIARWSAGQKIEIAVPRGETVFRNLPRVNGITVAYR
jgi:hypothetical protein